MRTIIVPLDGSPLAERAVEPALAFAGRSGANLVLLTVSEDPAHTWARRYLEERVGSLITTEGSDGRMPTIETEVVAGSDPARAIADLARETPGAAVLMSTHGRSGLETAVLGSVADAVVRTAGVPLLLVGPENRIDTWLHDPAHMIVCVDGSDLSHGVVDPAVAIALDLHAEMTVVRVLEPILALVPAPVPGAAGEPELPAIESVAKEIANRGVPAAYALLRPDNPATAIVRFAQEEPATVCIAVATHGRTGIGRVVLGSVAQRVVRRAPCPVLVYRPAAAA
jgi:nucleotide-binding universal stress UspA family protein